MITKMVECEIDSVRISLTNQDRVVVIKDKNSERYLPIWIGLFESEALTIALQGVQTARPLTHDLLLKAIQALGGQFMRVEIIAIEEDVYFAQLVLLQDGKQVNVDCRPSDALIMLARAHVPIFVSEEILASVAIQPEERRPYDLNTVDLEEGDAQDNLSVFSDFLSSLEGEPPQPYIEKAEPETKEEDKPSLAEDLFDEGNDDSDDDNNDDDDDDMDFSDAIFPKFNNN